MIEDLIRPASLEDVSSQYKSYISDPIKNLVKPNINDVEDNPFPYIELWINLFFKNPFVYLDAYFNQVYGLLYPIVDYNVESTGIYPTATDEFGISQRYDLNDIPPLIANYNAFTKSIPIINLVWGIGFQFIIISASMLIAFWRKNYIFICLCMPIICLTLTLLIATPVFAEARYLFANYVCAPFLLLASYIPWKSDSDLHSER